MEERCEKWTEKFELCLAIGEWGHQILSSLLFSSVVSFSFFQFKTNSNEIKFVKGKRFLAEVYRYTYGKQTKTT